MLCELSRESSSASSVPKPGAKRTSRAPANPPRRTRTMILAASFAMRDKPEPPDRSAVQQLLKVVVVVERGGVLYVLQNAVHALASFTVHFVELNRDAGPGLDSSHHAFGLQLAVIDREHDFYAARWRQNGTGFDVTPPQAEVG